MQVVYEEVLMIQFASREDLGLISISQIPLSVKGHFRYSTLSKNFHMDFSAVTWGPWSPVTFWSINFLAAMCQQINQPVSVIFRRPNYPCEATAVTPASSEAFHMSKQHTQIANEMPVDGIISQDLTQ